jgi:hypothetical protein
MIRLFLFNALLLGSCGFALLKGTRDSKAIAAICLAATAATYLSMSGYRALEGDIMIIDLMAFLGFTWVALRSDRYWPLWVAGLQLTTSLGHLLKAVSSDMVPLAYAAALRSWSYPILIILAVGVWRELRRREPDRIDYDTPVLH